MMWSLYLWTILSLTLVQSAPIEDIGELSLDLQPPFETLRDSRQLTDSYGQPISSSYIQAESTPEGRKIAKTGDGIQFEIPTYASGIIDDRKSKEDASSPPISTFKFSPTSSDTSGAIAPPSRLFQPPFLDSPKANRNFKINVPNNNFSEQPSTSFAERLGFDKQKSTGANDFQLPLGNPPLIQTFNIKLPSIDNIPFDKSPSLSPVTSQNPSPIAPANTFPHNIGQKPTIAVQPTNNINFGGAPGILGNQKPGYAVRPDGTIKDPDHEYKGPGAAEPIKKPIIVQKPVVSVPPPSTVNKYSGGFGGAPGILTPFDNGK